MQQAVVCSDFPVATSTYVCSCNAVSINLHRHADFHQVFKGISAQLHAALKTRVTYVGRSLLKKVLKQSEEGQIFHMQLDSHNNSINHSQKWDLARLIWA